jgi:hypothetical protein
MVYRRMPKTKVGADIKLLQGGWMGTRGETCKPGIWEADRNCLFPSTMLPRLLFAAKLLGNMTLRLKSTKIAKLRGLTKVR